MIKTIFLFFTVMMIGIPVYADDTKPGNEDFISSTVADVFDKIGQYTSGEKDILLEKNEGMDEDVGYERDALGRKVPDATRKSGKATPLDETL